MTTITLSPNVETPQIKHPDQRGWEIREQSDLYLPPGWVFVAPGEGNGLLIQDSSDILIEGALLYGKVQDSNGPGEGYGLTTVRCQRITVRNSFFTLLRNGAKITTTDDVTIEDCAVARFSANGFFFGECDGITVRRCQIMSAAIDYGEHGDAIQFAKPNDTTDPCRNILVEACDIHGLVQGIFGQGVQHALIEDNSLRVGFTNGISHVGGDDIVVRNNDIRTMAGIPETKQAQFNFSEATNVRYEGRNVVHAWQDREEKIYPSPPEDPEFEAAMARFALRWPLLEIGIHSRG